MAVAIFGADAAEQHILFAHLQPDLVRQLPVYEYLDRLLRVGRRDRREGAFDDTDRFFEAGNEAQIHPFQRIGCVCIRDLFGGEKAEVVCLEIADRLLMRQAQFVRHLLAEIGVQRRYIFPLLRAVCGAQIAEHIGERGARVGLIDARVRQFLLQQPVVDRIRIERNAHHEHDRGDQSQDQGKRQPLLGEDTFYGDNNNRPGSQKIFHNRSG